MTTPRMITGFIVNDASRAAPAMTVLRSGVVTNCVLLVKASDWFDDLTFDALHNGVSVFTRPMIVPARTSSILPFRFNLAGSSLTVRAGDQLTIKYKPRNSDWKFTVQLES